MSWNYEISDTSQLSSEEIKILRDKLYYALAFSLNDSEYYVECATGSNTSRTNGEIDMYNKCDADKKRKHRVCEIFVLKDTPKYKYEFPLAICTNDLETDIDYYFATSKVVHIKEDHTNEGWAQKIRFFLNFKDLDNIIQLIGGKSFIENDINQ